MLNYRQSRAEPQAEGRKKAPNHECRIHDPETVRAALTHVVEGVVFGRDWQGRTGLACRSSFIALLRIGQDHGQLIVRSDGEVLVWVQASVRQWAERAGVQKATISGDASKGRIGHRDRLVHEHGVIRRAERGSGPESDAFVIPTSIFLNGTLGNSYHRSSRVSLLPLKCPVLRGPRVAFRHRGLGNTKECILDVVRRLGGGSASEIATCMGRPDATHRIRRHLKELAVDRILDERRGDRFVLSKYAAGEIANVRAALDAETGADERQRELHQREREAFNDSWKRGEVLNKEELAKRRRRISEAKREATAKKKERRESEWRDHLERREREPERANLSLVQPPAEPAPLPDFSFLDDDVCREPVAPEIPVAATTTAETAPEAAPELSEADQAVLRAIMAYEAARGPGSFGWDRASCKGLFYSKEGRGCWPELDELERIRAYAGG